MKKQTMWLMALAVIAGACLYLAVSDKRPVDKPASKAAADTGSEVEVVMESQDGELQVATLAAEKDPAWTPSCSEVAMIQVGDGKENGKLKNFCLNAEGDILACFGSGVRVYSPRGELLKTLPLEIRPTAICRAADGSIFVAGDGRLLKLDAAGKVLASARSPVAEELVIISAETEEMIKESARNTKRPFDEELARMRERLEKRRADVTGLAVTGEDVFMSVPSPSDFTYRVYRFDNALEASSLVVEKLRGCCGQMDVQAHEGQLWVSHNARHCVEQRDRDGNLIAKFGKAGKVRAADFGGCCEPKNLRILPDGDILAAESGPPTCIKRFSADGKFKEVVVAFKTKGDCVRVTVEMSPDGRQFYMLDTTRDAIRVFAPRS